MSLNLTDSHGCMNTYICSIKFLHRQCLSRWKKDISCFLASIRFCMLLSRSSTWRQVTSVTLNSFKSMMGLQHQRTCWENTVDSQVLQSFSVPTTLCIFGYTQTTALPEVLLFIGNPSILVS